MCRGLTTSATRQSKMGAALVWITPVPSRDQSGVPGEDLLEISVFQDVDAVTVLKRHEVPSGSPLDRAILLNPTTGRNDNRHQKAGSSRQAAERGPTGYAFTQDGGNALRTAETGRSPS